jgi:hypothetical protein
VIFSAPVRLDVLVGDDLQLASDEGEDRLLADQPAVPLVVRMDGDGGVGEHRLRTHGRNRDRPGSGGQRVVDVVERVADIALLDLEVGDRRAGAGIPVDHVPVAVDVALLVQGDEDLQHRPGVLVVQGESLGLVVRRRAETLELLDDRPAIPGPPLPHPLDELLTAQLLTARPLRGKRALDLGLGGDAGVVRAENPLGPLSQHAVIANEAVLDAVVERVPHVEHSGDVRRGDRDRVVLVRRTLRLRMKQPGLQPLLHDPRLHLGRVVAGRRFEIGHVDESRSGARKSVSREDSRQRILARVRLSSPSGRV